MTVPLALRFREQLSEPVGNELEQMVATINQSLLAAPTNLKYRCASLNLLVTQVIPTGAFTALTFNFNETDAAGMHASVGSRFTIKKGGMYALRCAGNFATNAVGQRILRGVRNNVPIFGGSQIGGSPGGVYAWHVGYAVDIELRGGDVIEFQVFQDSGGNLNIGVAAAGAEYYTTRASLVRYAD